MCNTVLRSVILTTVQPTISASVTSHSLSIPGRECGAGQGGPRQGGAGQGGLAERLKRLLRVDSDSDTQELHTKYKETALDREKKLKQFEEQLNIKVR